MYQRYRDTLPNWGEGAVSDAHQSGIWQVTLAHELSKNVPIWHHFQMRFLQERFSHCFRQIAQWSAAGAREGEDVAGKDMLSFS